MKSANLNDLSDSKLLNVYLAGNQSAINTLIERHKRRVFDHVNIMVRNRELAEDITQDTFVKALNFVNTGRYNDSGKFLAWVLRIAQNQVLDYFRQTKKRTHITEDDAGYDLLNNRQFATENIEQDLISQQIRDDVRRMVDFLPDEQKDVVILRYYQNLSFKEIAEQTGVSINTALGRMRYALINMRKLMKEKNIILS